MAKFVYYSSPGFALRIPGKTPPEPEASAASKAKNLQVWRLRGKIFAFPS